MHTLFPQSYIKKPVSYNVTAAVNSFLINISNDKQLS